MSPQTPISELTVGELQAVIREAVMDGKRRGLVPHQELAEMLDVHPNYLHDLVNQWDIRKLDRTGMHRPEGSRTNVYYSLAEVQEHRRLPHRVVQNDIRQSQGRSAL